MPTPQNKTPLILTLDIGTSSTRAMLFNHQARPVPGMLAQIANQLRTTTDGGAEFDPQKLLGNIVNLIDTIIQQAGPLAHQIQGVATDTFVTNIMGLHKSGQPLTPIFTYTDTRNAADAEALRQEFNLSAVHNRTGCRIHSAYLPAHFRWLSRTQPNLWRQVNHWLSIGEYILWEFFGERRVSYSVASWSGLLNRQTLSWDQTWLDYLSLPENSLSPLADVDQPLQGLQEPWATRWPMLKNVPWFPAIGDGAAANLGSGCTGPDRLALTIGTTGAMRVALKRPPDTIPAGLWLYRINQTYALLGGATSEGGNIFAWLNKILQLPPHIETELARLPPAGHGLTILPFIAGERAPGWQAAAKACINGLTLNTRPIDILQAGLESVAYRFALIHDRIKPYLPPGHQIIASGSGLLNSPAWMQIMADVLGRPLVASAEKEATSRGITLLALNALGIKDKQAATTGITYQPNDNHYAQYQVALEQQSELYKNLIL